MGIAALSWYKKLSRLRSATFAERLAPYFQPHTHVLDFGCGNMFTAQELCKRIPDLKITGIDVVQDQNLDLNVLENASSLEFRLLTQKHLPFENHTFDTVLALATMHHTFSPEYYITELKRVCKPEGKIILVEEMYVNLLDKIYISAQDYILNKMKKGVPVPLQFRSKRQYLDIFRDNGLYPEIETYIRPLPTLMHHYVFVLRNTSFKS